jgi:hypothetical protein
MALPVGDYQAVVRPEIYEPQVGSFGFTVAGGGLTDLGAFATHPPTSATITITGAILFNGGPVVGISGPSSCLPYFGSQGQPYAPIFSEDTGDTEAHTQHLGVWVDRGFITTHDEIWVIDGVVVTEDFETADSAGVVVGTITVNGIALPNANLQFSGGGAHVDCEADDNGQFKVLLPANTSTTLWVWTPEYEFFVGTVEFNLSAGLDTNADCNRHAEFHPDADCNGYSDTNRYPDVNAVLDTDAR